MHRLELQLSTRMKITVEANDVKNLIKESILWSEVPAACPLCGAELGLLYRTPQTYEYFGLKCTGPTPHEITFGEYKDTSKGLYYNHANQWAESRRDAQQPTGPANTQDQGPVEFPAEPVARSLGELVTAKQLGMIRALAREINVDADEECTTVMHCNTDELTKRAASSLIQHMQETQKRQAAGEAPVRRTVVTMPEEDDFR